MAASVPGHVGFALVGDYSLEFYRDPIAFVEKQRRRFRSPTFRLRFLNKTTVFVTSNAAVREALNFTDGTIEHGYRAFLHHVFGDMILFEDGQNCQALRNSLHRLFTPSKLETYEAFVTKKVHSIVRTIEKASQPNGDTSQRELQLYSLFKRYATEFCLELFLSIDRLKEPALLEQIIDLSIAHWHGVISVPLSLRIPGISSSRSTYSLSVEARRKLLAIIRERVQSSSHGSQAGFLNDIQCCDMPGDEGSAVLNHLLLFSCALAPKALASLLTSTVLALYRHDLSCESGSINLDGAMKQGTMEEPLMPRLSEDAKLTEASVLEAARLWPPFVGGRRLIRSDCIIAGHRVDKGQALVYISHTAHRDPDVFPEPSEYKPERWFGTNAMDRDKIFTFGYGARDCIGQQLVKNFVCRTVQELCRNFTWFPAAAQSCPEPGTDTLGSSEQDECSSGACNNGPNAHASTDPYRYKWLPVSRPLVDPAFTFYTRNASDHSSISQTLSASLETCATDSFHTCLGESSEQVT